MKKKHSQSSGTARESKISEFENGNQRLSFLGMDGNGNFRSPLQCPDISFDLLADLNPKYPPNIVINQPQLAVDTLKTGREGKPSNP